MKIKTYVIIVSEKFPGSHPRAGEPTQFQDKIETGRKIHTIRQNVDLWKGRIDKVAAGEAVISIRKWSGLPYRSKQQEILVLGKDDGVGLQVVTPVGKNIVVVNSPGLDEANAFINRTALAENDGLTRADLDGWFKGWTGGDKAIIHFSAWRYKNPYSISIGEFDRALKSTGL